MSGAPTAIVWVHGDNLHPNGPALSRYPDAPALWVWDEALLAQWAISLKRILFLTECLLDLPVVIRKGDVAAELAQFADDYGTRRIASAESPSPRFRAICTELERQGYEVEILAERSLISAEIEPDLRRFSRYWQVAKPHLLTEPDP